MKGPNTYTIQVTPSKLPNKKSAFHDFELYIGLMIRVNYLLFTTAFLARAFQSSSARAQKTIDSIRTIITSRT
jgi:hypothetical protein